MKLRKVITVAAMTAAIGTISVFSSFADEMTTEEKAAAAAEAAADAAEESTFYGWVERGANWYYYDNNGVMQTGWLKAPGGDGRGNEVWYYLEPSTGVMVANQTKVIDGIAYSFGEDGSWVAPTQVAPKGKVSGKTYYNTWSNLRIDQIIGDVIKDVEDEDRFASDEYAAVGSPKMTHDIYIEAPFGEMEIYYLNMKNKPDMTAAVFAKEFGNIEKAAKGTASAVETVTIAGQEYSRVTVNGKYSSRSFYCRKKDGYMIVIATIGNMAGYLDLITTAQ